MKNSQIAFWIATLGGILFLYNIHQIHDVEVDADTWAAKVDANNNPGVGTYAKAFFDGLTLGAFSGGDVFAEAHKGEQTNNELEAERVALLRTYQDAVWYRNLGFVLVLGGVAVGIFLKGKRPNPTV